MMPVQFSGVVISKGPEGHVYFDIFKHNAIPFEYFPERIPQSLQDCELRKSDIWVGNGFVNKGDSFTSNTSAAWLTENMAGLKEQHSIVFEGDLKNVLNVSGINPIEFSPNTIEAADYVMRNQPNYVEQTLDPKGDYFSFSFPPPANVRN